LTCENIKEYVSEGRLLGFTGFTRSFADCAIDGNSSACERHIGVTSVAKTPERLPNVDYVAPFVFDIYSVMEGSRSLRWGLNSNVVIFAPSLLGTCCILTVSGLT
jgi:hypothetical protein